MRVLLTGGGSGGHITPLIAVSREIKKQAAASGITKVDFVFVGPAIQNKLWEGLLKKEGIRIVNVVSGKMRRYFSLANITDILFKVPYGFLQGLLRVFENMPDVVFSKGGYGSIPVIFASRFYMLPVVIHESDAVLGLANKRAVRHAKLITCGFKETLEMLPKKRSLYTGNPVRQELLEGSLEMARQFFRLHVDKPVLLVVGGSQGAEFINDMILNNLDVFIKEFEIIHITGQKKFELLGQELEARFGKLDFTGYHPYPFLTDGMKEAYAAADVIISRAGANVIAEIANVGKPSILIPLPGSAQDHQKINAYLYGQSGAAIVMEEENMLPHLLMRSLKEIINNGDLRNSMINAAKNFNPPDAASVIAKEVMKYT